MSDILQEAEEMMKHPNGYAPSQITQIVGGLVAEIKRLRDAALVDDLIANCNQLRDRCRKAEGELAKWQATAIDERANQIAGLPVSRLKDKYKRNAYREQAANELDLQLEQEDDIPTIAYMLGGKKADERLKVLQGYVGRLETAYLQLKYDSLPSCPTYCRSARMDEAMAALDEIREEQA